MVQFESLRFRRTSKNYFGQFVWIEKKNHYNSRVYFIKRRLKIGTHNIFTLQNRDIWKDSDNLLK